MVDREKLWELEDIEESSGMLTFWPAISIVHTNSQYLWLPEQDQASQNSNIVHEGAPP